MLSVSCLKKQAKKLLYRDWITHIGAFFTVFVSTSALATVASTIMVLSLEYTNIFVYSLIFLSLLTLLAALCIPLYYGLFVFEYNAVNTDKTDIKDIFYAFSTPERYRRSFLTAFAVFWRFLVVFSVPLFIFSELYLYLAGESQNFIQVAIGGYDITYTYLCVLLAVAFVISFLYFTRYFTAIYIVIECEDARVSKCFFAAKIFNRKCLSTLILVTLSYIPLAVISVLTFGILFIIYTLPVILITYFCISSHVCNDSKLNRIITDFVFDTNK